MMRGGGRHAHGMGPHGWEMRGRYMMSFIEPALLLLLYSGGSHGYALKERLKSDFDMDVMTTNRIYRALRMMEGRGWIYSDWDEDESQGPPRRVYRLTRDGQDVLGYWMKDLELTRDAINRILSEYRTQFGDSQE